jgi:hypothetical protein
VALSNELCNPTPWEVQIPYHKGIVINVPPDGKVELTVDQMDDFRSGKPGSEAVQELTSYYGVFLRDNTRTYEAQALEAIRACIAAKREQRRGAEIRLRQMGAADGATWSPEQYQQTLSQLGYDKIDKEIAALEGRSKFLAKELESSSDGRVHKTFDPERTLIFLDPPREFPSKIALQMFLNDSGNEALKQQYESWKAMQDSDNAV